MADPLYDRLVDLLQTDRTRVELAHGIGAWDVADVMTVIWPEFVESIAKNYEYEHALNHVAELHEPQCSDCQRLAQSALDGVNRDMGRELASDG